MPDELSNFFPSRAEVIVWPHDATLPDGPASMPQPSPERRNSSAESPSQPAADEQTPARGLPKRLRKTHVAQDDVAAAAASRRSATRLDQSREHARRCAQILEDNRGRDILILDLRNATPLVDFFVIGTASSRRQAAAMASDVDADMKRRGEVKLGMEGVDDGRWVLIDYGDFVVHIFSEDARGAYALEELWGDAQHVDWTPDSARPAPQTDRA